MKTIANQAPAMEPVLMGLWLATMVSLAILYLVAPAGYGIFTTVSVVMLVVAVLSLVSHPVLLYVVLATSVFSSMLRNADTVTVGGTTVSLSGLRWIWVFGILAAILVKNYPRVQVRGPFLPLLAFTAWVAVRWTASPSGIGLRDVLFYSLPVMIAIYTMLMLATESEALTTTIESGLLWTVVIPPIAYAICIPAGLVTLEAIGPEGVIDPRTIAEYMLILQALALARWRYADTAGSRKLGFVVTCVCLATCVLTLSRFASVVAVAMLCVARSNVWQLRKLFIPILASAALAVSLVWFFPAFRTRFFTNPDGAFSEDFPYINTEGRIVFWAITAAHAVQKPVLGWGPGSARLLVGEVGAEPDQEEYHPHNDYLQVWHDLGIIGLILMLWGWIPLLRRHWKCWRSCDAGRDYLRARWHMAAMFALIVVLSNAMIGNTLHETYVAAPALMISASAIWLSRRQDFSRVAHLK